MSLSGTAALVTGAASGIGAATVSIMRKQFDLVVAVDRDEQSLRDRWTDQDGVLPWILDVTDEKAIGLLKERLAADLQLRAVVNSAGIYRSGRLEEFPLDDLEAMWTINAKSAFLMSRIAAPCMKLGGSIVNISSVASQLSTETNWAYGTVKGAVNSLTRGMAVALAPSQIRVNAIAPGPIETPMADVATSDPAYATKMYDRIPLQRPGTALDVAELAGFLVSHASNWLTGQIICLDGGLTAVR